MIRSLSKTSIVRFACSREVGEPRIVEGLAAAGLVGGKIDFVPQSSQQAHGGLTDLGPKNISQASDEQR